MSSNNDLDKLQTAWRIALAGAHGEIILSDLTLQANQQVHVAGDPYTSAFNDGMRIMARNILTLIEDDDNVPHETKVLR